MYVDTILCKFKLMLKFIENMSMGLEAFSFVDSRCWVCDKDIFMHLVNNNCNYVIKIKTLLKFVITVARYKIHFFVISKINIRLFFTLIAETIKS